MWERLGTDDATVEPDGTLRLDAPLGWCSRPGSHSLGAEDRALFRDHADLRL